MEHNIIQQSIVGNTNEKELEINTLFELSFFPNISLGKYILLNQWFSVKQYTIVDIVVISDCS